MTRDKFHEIWTKSVTPRSELLCKVIGDDSISFHPESETHIRIHYQKTRQTSKGLLIKAVGKADAENLLDRHKVASMIMYSIVVLRPLRLRRGQSSFCARYANEFLGLICGLDIIKTFMHKDGINPPLLQTPSTSPENYIMQTPSEKKPESYIMQTLRCIWFAKERNCFDIFSFANIFFFIEKYSFIAQSKENSSEIDDKRA